MRRLEGRHLQSVPAPERPVADPRPDAHPDDDRRADALIVGARNPLRPAGSPPQGHPGGDPLQEWLQTPAGRYILQWEQARLDEAVADVFGFHALQCGGPLPDGLRSNRMPHRLAALTPGAQAPDGICSLVRVAQFDELPIDTGSLDLLVLPHVLEFSAAPHDVLREAERVLRPEGRLIVSGFNPASLWGIRQAAPAGLLRPLLPDPVRLIGLPRLRDWFTLLGLDIGSVQYGCFRPLVRNQTWLDRTRFMESAGDRWWPICGAAYLVSAIKRVPGMRRVSPVKRRAVRGTVVALPGAHCEPGTSPERSALPVQREAPPYR